MAIDYYYNIIICMYVRYIRVFWKTRAEEEDAELVMKFVLQFSLAIKRILTQWSMLY